MVYYAVSNGKSIGIFTNWNDCKESVNCYPNALYKKFDTKQEAEDFIALSNNKDTKNVKQNKITDFLEKTTKINELSSTDFIPEYYVYTEEERETEGKDRAESLIDDCYLTKEVKESWLYRHFDMESAIYEVISDGYGSLFAGWDGCEYHEDVYDETYYIYRNN